MHFQRPRFSEWPHCFWSAVEAAAGPDGVIQAQGVTIQEVQL